MNQTGQICFWNKFHYYDFFFTKKTKSYYLHQLVSLNKYRYIMLIFIIIMIMVDLSIDGKKSTQRKKKKTTTFKLMGFAFFL